MKHKPRARPPPTTRNIPELGISDSGLNRFAVCSGSRFREQPGFQSNPSLLPPERCCEEQGMLSATQTHLAKELSNDTDIWKGFAIKQDRRLRWPHPRLRARATARSPYGGCLGL